MAWKLTPKSERFDIKRYDRESGQWGPCEFSELRKGDIYAAFAHDGTQLEPVTGEPVGRPDMVARTTMDARHSETRGFGYEAEVMVGPPEDALRWEG